MQLTDVKIIKASPDVVWAAILNPDVLMQCVPGCQSMTGSVEDGFEATVKQKIGPVSATFSGVVKLSDIDVTVQGTKATALRALPRAGPRWFWNRCPKARNCLMRSRPMLAARSPNWAAA